VQTVRNGIYLAGLWSDSLVLDMLWRKNGQYCREPLRAPSWSWASGKGSIYFRQGEEKDKKLIVEAEIVGFDRLLDGPSATGKVKSGWIKLKSSIIKCRLEADNRISFSVGEQQLYLLEADSFNFDSWTRLSQFMMVRMATTMCSQRFKGYEEMLLVQALGDDGTHFKRVGYAERMDPDPPIVWPEERREITII